MNDISLDLNLLIDIDVLTSKELDNIEGPFVSLSEKNVE